MLKTAVVVVGLITAMATGTIGAVNYFAKSSDFEAFVAGYQRDEKIERYEKIQERIWYLEEKYRPPRPPAVEDELRRLYHELKIIEKELG